MIKVIREKDRFEKNLGWLKARWHFSFDDYHDPANIHWGALRVFNDDVIQPGRGFGFHPHRDMEIITIVLEGALEHKDNTGGHGIIRPGEVQVMTAGKGVLHSEVNPSDRAAAHLLQIWILPDTKGLPPRYDQRAFDPTAWKNQWQALVSDGSVPGTLSIHQNAIIYRAQLDPGVTATHATDPGRKPYLFVIEGRVRVNGEELNQSDQARIAQTSEVSVEAMEPADVLLLDVPVIA